MTRFMVRCVLSVATIAAGSAVATNTPLPAPQETACKHWDKIVFEITDQKVASQYNQPASTPLDIKVLDEITEVADLRQKVVYFLRDKAGLPNTPTTGDSNSKDVKAIKITDVEYAIECEPISTTVTKTVTATTVLPTTLTTTATVTRTTTTATTTTATVTSIAPTAAP